MASSAALAPPSEPIHATPSPASSSRRPAPVPSFAAAFGAASDSEYDGPRPPKSGNSTASVESTGPLTPNEVPPLARSSYPLNKHPQMPRDSSTSRLKRADFAVPQIPPFKGSAAPPDEGAGSAASSSSRPSASAPPPSASVSVLSRSDSGAARRVSHPSVFSFPAPAPPNPRPSSSTTTGLGIEGVGVGAAGAKEALVIEGLGEPPAPVDGSGGKEGRRGSLKRVLISDEEDELASVREAAAPAVQAGSAAGGDAGEGDPLLPLPLQQPPSQPALAHRDSASSLRRAGSSSPQQGRDSPPSSSNKRQRIVHSPLQSLADTASNILATTSATPTPSVLASQPAHPPAGSAPQLRRRDSATISAVPSPLSARRGSVIAVASEDGRTSGSGLAKRRGHRPPAVTTAGPTPHTTLSAHPRASLSAAPGHTFIDSFGTLRSAPIEIPSVLVGSPMEATFAAQAARERDMRASLPGGPSSARETAPAPRRQSGGTAGGAQPQPPLVSSSTYYIRPSQPFGPGAGFSSQGSSSQQRPPSQGGMSPRSSAASKDRERLAAPSAQGPPPPRLPPMRTSAPNGTYSLPPSARGGGGPHSSGPTYHHSGPLYPPPHSASGSFHYGPPSPLPPLSASVAAPGAPTAPSPSFSALPPHSAGLVAPAHPSAAAAGAASSGSSKQAFMSLFSTFYDSLSDSRILTSSLDSQLHRAAQLLHTLQQAEATFEGALSDVRRDADARFRAIEDRVARLEAGARRGSGSSAAGMPPAARSSGALEERLERLERLLAEREADGPTDGSGGPRRPSDGTASTTSSGAVADTEAGGPASEARDDEMDASA
ncbi:uncharacterized protein JCM10292_004634 [Rhodotorula paludigena]|uniref:uncharacterized protein n=1 Tax=Rhodotorula paludigena TaxID=86838 RepID=UPI00317EA2E9